MRTLTITTTLPIHHILFRPLPTSIIKLFKMAPTKNYQKDNFQKIPNRSRKLAVVPQNLKQLMRTVIMIIITSNMKYQSALMWDSQSTMPMACAETATTQWAALRRLKLVNITTDQCMLEAYARTAILAAITRQKERQRERSSSSLRPQLKLHKLSLSFQEEVDHQNKIY